MEQILTEELVKRTIEDTLHTLDRIGQGYRKCFITQTDCFYTMLSEFRDGFWSFLKNKGIKIRIDKANYKAFSEEYSSFIKGENFKDEYHMPWLFSNSGHGESSEEDRKLVMYMMGQYCLSPDYFEPMPEEIKDPGRVYAHGWHDSTAYGLAFKCVDDGGLSSDEDCLGKTYWLVSDLGLEAVVTIKEDRRKGERIGLDFDEMAESVGNGMAVRLAHFLAEGYIEGYTSKVREGNPDIIIRLDNKGKVYWLAYYASSDDEKTYGDYPLWQDYFRWSNEKAAKEMDILSALFAKYINQDEEI